MHAMQESCEAIFRIEIVSGSHLDMLRPPAERARAVGQPLEVEYGQPAVREHASHLVSERVRLEYGWSTVRCYRRCTMRCFPSPTATRTTDSASATSTSAASRL